MKLEVDSFDYQEAIKAVDDLLSHIYSDNPDVDIHNIPNGAQIVDIVIDKIV